MSTSKKRRRWPWILGIAATALGLTAFFYLKDEPLGDHSDLEPPAYVATQEELEAIALWIEARELLNEANEGLDRNSVRAHQEIDFDTWDAELHLPILERLETPLAAARRASRLPAVGFLEPLSHSMVGIVTADSLAQLTEIPQLLTAGIVAQHHRGDDIGACEHAAFLLGSSDAFIERGGYLVEHVIALGVNQRALSTIHDLFDRSMPRKGLLVLKSCLADAPHFLETLDPIFRNEFLLVRNLVLDLTPEALAQITAFQDPNSPKAPPWFQFRKNRTINQLARDIEEARWRLKTPAYRRDPDTTEQWPKTWIHRLSPNATGNWLLYGLAPVAPFTIIIDQADKATALRHLALARCALLVHFEDNGTLPADLSDIVPSQLAAVPLDPYDQKPLRYDRDAGILWSVGIDLRDDGGDRSDFSQPVSKRDDLTVRILPPTR